MSTSHTPAPDPPYDGYHKYDSSVAAGYDQTRENQKHWAEEDRFVAAYFCDRRIGRLLDLPVGTGRFFRHYCRVQHVTGIDISDEMLAEASKKLPLLPPGTVSQLERGDVLALRFTDQAFDAALVVRLFHLIPPHILPQAVAELCRVSKMVIAQTYATAALSPTPTPRRIQLLLSRIRHRFITNPPPPSHSLCTPAPLPVPPATPWSHIQAYYQSQSFIDALFNACGFVVVTTQTVDRYEGMHVNFTEYARPSQNASGSR